MVRVGIIGVGNCAQAVHVTGVRDSKGGKVVAICDIDPEKLQKVGDLLDLDEAHRFENYMDLIHCDEVDAVEICTPNHLHVPIALEAIKAGKPFQVEKPISVNKTEAQKLVDAVKENPVPNMVCFSYRYRSSVRYAKDIISRGLLGDIIQVNVEYQKDSGYWKDRPMEWRFEKKYAGTGVLGDLGVHVIDMAQFLIGDIVRVCGRTGIVIKERPIRGTDKMGKVETDDYCNFLVDFANGCSGVFSATRCAIGQGNTIRYSIFGTKGMIGFNLNKPDEMTVCIGELDVETRGSHVIKVPAKYKVLQEQTFVDMVAGKECQYLPTVEDGLKCQKILDAVLESSEHSCWVEV